MYRGILKSGIKEYFGGASPRRLGSILEAIQPRSKQGNPTARFGEYLFGRPKSPGLFGFNCSVNKRLLWRNITSDFRDKGTD